MRPSTHRATRSRLRRGSWRAAPPAAWATSAPPDSPPWCPPTTPPKTPPARAQQPSSAWTSLLCEPSSRLRAQHLDPGDNTYCAVALLQASYTVAAKHRRRRATVSRRVFRLSRSALRPLFQKENVPRAARHNDRQLPVFGSVACTGAPCSRRRPRRGPPWGRTAAPGTWPSGSTACRTASAGPPGSRRTSPASSYPAGPETPANTAKVWQCQGAPP